MNEREKDFEKDMLSRALHDRSRQAEGLGVGLDDVLRTAKGIRRRRRIVSGAAGLAVLAVVVPLGIQVAGVGDAGAPPVSSSVPSTGTTPSAVDSASASPTPTGPAVKTVTIDLSSLTQGAAPSVSYLEGRTVHSPDQTLPAPDGEYAGFTVYHGGYLVASDKNGVTTVQWLDNTMTPSGAPRTGSQSFAVSDSGQTAYFVTPGAGKPGELRLGIGSGMGDLEQVQHTPAGALVTPIGFVGGSAVVYQQDQDIYVTDFGSSAPRKLTGLLRVGGTNQATGVLVAQVQSLDTGSCWGLIRASDDHQLWRECDYSLGRISNDGTHLIGTPAYLDGATYGSLTLLDTKDHHPLVTFDGSAQGFGFYDSVWQDDSHVLAIATDGSHVRIVRLGLDGSVEAATAPVADGDFVSPLTFAATP